MSETAWLTVLDSTERMVRVSLEKVEKYATDPRLIPDQKPLIASLRRLASVLSDIERAKARTPGQRGRPAIFQGDDAERERYRGYLLSGMGSRQIELTGQEHCSRDTINSKLQQYSEELGIERKTRFGRGRKGAI